MIILYSFSLFLAFLAYQISNRFKFGVVSFIIGLYLLSSVCSVILYYYSETDSDYVLDVEPTLFFLLSLFIVFLGFARYKDAKFNYIIIQNARFLVFFEKVFLICSISAVLFFSYASHAIFNIGSSIEGTRNLIGSGQFAPLEGYGIYNSFFSLVANLFVLNLIFFFLNLIEGYPTASRKKAFLHVFSSFSYVLYILSYMGRDGIVYWVITSGFMFLIFRGFLRLDVLYRVKKLFFLSGLLLLIPFSIITHGRFSSSGFLLSIIDYMGQQIFNFNKHYVLNAPIEYGNISFAPLVKLFSSIVGIEYNDFNRNKWFTYFLDHDVLPWVFLTFLGSFLHDFGRTGVFVSAIVMMCILLMTLYRLSKLGYIEFSGLIIFIVFIQIVTWGVFYYRQYSAFYYLLFMFCLYVFLKMSSRSTVVVLYKIRDVG